MSKKIEGGEIPGGGETKTTVARVGLPGKKTASEEEVRTTGNPARKRNLSIHIREDGSNLLSVGNSADRGGWITRETVVKG